METKIQKRAVILLIALCGLLGIHMSAIGAETIPEQYEYKQLFTEGKSWVMWHGVGSPSEYETHLIFNVAVDGEKEIDGITCKRIRVEIDKSHSEGTCMECMYFLGVDDGENAAPALPEYIYAYEKDKKIYVYRESGPYYEYDEDGFVKELKYGKPYFEMLMNLDVNLGDTAMGMGEITNVEYKEFGGVTRRVISNDVSYLGSDNPTEWIEGIGSNYCADEWEWYLPLTTAVPTMMSNWYHNFLVKCSDGGEVIYDNSQNLKSAGVNLDGVGSVTTIGTPEEAGVYYNLQGIAVSNPQKGNIYIHNGKKVIYK